MGRVALSLLLVTVVACSAPAAAPPAVTHDAAIPAADPGPGAMTGPESIVGAAQDPVEPLPRAAAAVTPREAPAARAFPFGERLAEWIPATPQNYQRGRGGEPITHIVIHYTAISYERTLRAFTIPRSRVSAHYVVRADGHVAQMVSEDDTAWHAGHYWFNQRSVGIEIELAPGESNTEFTAEQYYSTASLVCGIAARHGIPLDRARVVGHNEIPGTGKIDPGPTWGWPHFMWLTSLCAPPSAGGLHAAFVSQTVYPEIEVDQFGTFTVVLRNDGAVAWRKGTSSELRLGLVGASQDPTLVGHGWPLPDRPAVQQEDIVPPGGTATFTLRVRGAVPGDFLLRFRPVVDGVAWMPDMGLYTVVQVKAKKLRTAEPLEP